MLYQYVKAIHIIFIVTWFSGMFYLPRLFIYNTEANEKPEFERRVLQEQFGIMIRRLWLGITWPSAILTLIFGGWMGWLYGYVPEWLLIKIGLVSLLYAYHFTLHKIYLEQRKGIFRYSSLQLRIWNEAATVLLVSIVLLVVVKTNLSPIWGVTAIICLMILLLAAIRIYKKIRKGQ